MLLSCYIRFPYKQPVTRARLAFRLLPASPPAFILHASLLHSCCNSISISEVGGSNLKISGLRLSVPFSATQNLAYLPCRIAGDSSTFLFFSGGGVSEKNAPRLTPNRLFSSRLYGQFCPHFPVLSSRSAFMRFEPSHVAIKMFPSHAHVPCSAPAPRGPRTLRGAVAGVPPSLGSPVSSRAEPGVPPRELFPSRCCQKACVFPAQPGGRGECAYHRRQSLEPGCFQSLQPSFLLLDQAKFGLPDSEPDDARVRDRNRLAAERVRFMLGEAA